MTPLVREYLLLERRMLEARERYDEAAEDKVMDEMDQLWFEMSDSEQDHLDGRNGKDSPQVPQV